MRRRSFTSLLAALLLLAPALPARGGDRADPPAGDPASEAVPAAEREAWYFEPVSPERAAAAIRAADKEAEASLAELGVRMRRLESPHFLVYTDWETVDDPLLIETLEAAYARLCDEFAIPGDLNVFIGKLPVYMFDSHTTFLRYARDVDRNANFRVTVAGYYRASGNGMGKLVMSKPATVREDGLELARKRWNRTLTHEFAHAFLARYRSNAFLPRWLNEGVAEVIADEVYARPRGREMAREAARSGRSMASVFDDRVMPTPQMYPVMMTMVEVLQRQGHAKFVAYIQRLKAGEPPEAVMREMYGLDYEGLEAAWRRQMSRP